MVAERSELPAVAADDVLWLIDLSNYVFRAYHAMPALTNSRGEATHATLGTLNMLNRMIEDRRPAYLAVVMDSPGRGFRGEMYADYKANRAAAPDDLKQQIRRCGEIFEAYGVPIFSQAGYEADDLIASLTKLALEADLRVVIASSDKDLMQLVVAGKVLCWDAMRNNVYGPAEVEKKFGVAPERVRDVLALTGDSSDNIPGVPGVGPKTAAKLIAEHGTLNAVLESIDQVKRPKLRQSLEEHQQAARLAYDLVTLRLDADVELDVEALRYGGADVERLRALFTELQFTRFLDMLPDADTADADPKDDPRNNTEEQAELDSEATPTYRVISGRKLLEILVGEARRSGTLAVVALGPRDEAMWTPLTGLALSPARGNAAYVPLGHLYLTAPKQLPLEDVREVLGPLLADRSVAKVGHDLKFTQVVLEHHGMPVRGARADSMLASYLLDPESTHKLGIVAERELGMRWTAFEQLVPKVRKGPKLTIEQVDVELATPYGCAHAEAAMRLTGKLGPRLQREGLQKLHDDLEIPLLDVLTRMELCGVLVDPEPLKMLGREMSEEVIALERRAWELSGREFNLASPKQLEAVLFDELGLRSSRKTKTGRSTDAEALEAIAQDHPLPQVVLEHRGLSKLQGTYVDALPRLIHPYTGRIHTRWDQAVTATGRISSKEPNLQNIPVRTPHGKRIREAFVAPESMVILSADYSQIELRVLAHLSHDPLLLEAFEHGRDVHVLTAMAVFGVPQEEVTGAMRAQSKTVNFGVIYGMGAFALSKRLSISRAEAKAFIDAYFERYAGVREFMSRTLAEAKDTKQVRTLLGRRRKIPELTSSNHARRAYAERIAQNTPIQGSAADLLKLAMVRLAEPVLPGVRMVLTVHDELVFEVPREHADEAAAKIKAAMESVYPLDVPLVVDVAWGAHWADAH